MRQSKYNSYNITKYGSNEQYISYLSIVDHIYKKNYLHVHEVDHSSVT